MNHVDHETLRAHARGDGRVREPIEPEPSGPRYRGLVDRIVIGGTYLVQWLRSRWTSKHAGRS